ncbi:MAG TPA: GtrA family protein [Patescibacteria group bacterium]|nr:GtrA family protein [Patescibacteria group bacterium]
MRRLLKSDFIRFCIVGALGFVINFIILTLLYKVLGSPLFISQIIAAEIALFSNFMFHHHWTYKASKVRKTLTKLIVQFHLTSWVAVIGSALIVSAGVNILHLHYFPALVISAGLAMMWNFGWSKFVIWRKHAPIEKSDQSEEVS